jgi:hypothetical protein
VGDLNKNLNENKWWGTWNDGVHPLQTPDAYDDNWAWGWTLDGQINFNLDLNSAAYATLVLDETYGELVESPYEHFTTIVNVKIYSPGGALVDHFEVTKVWTLEDPVPTTMVLEQSLDGGDTWTQADSTVYGSSVMARVRVLDQWGAPMYTNVAMPDEAWVQAVGTIGGINLRTTWQINTIQMGPNDADGWAYFWLTGFAPAQWTLTAWLDWDTSGTINSGDLVSNTKVDQFYPASVVGGVSQPPVTAAEKEHFIGAVRWMNFDSDSQWEHFLGIQDLGVGGNRVGDQFVTWGSSTHVKFTYDSINDKLIGDVGGQVLEYPNFSAQVLTLKGPVVAARLARLDLINIMVMVRDAGASVAFNNVKLNGATIPVAGGNLVGVYDSAYANAKAWQLTADFANGFTLEGDIVISGTFGSQENSKVEIMFGNTIL